MYFCLQETLDAVENLIKKHEAFEKSAATQEERFAALEKLTTVRNMSVIPNCESSGTPFGIIFLLYSSPNKVNMRNIMVSLFVVQA